MHNPTPNCVYGDEPHTVHGSLRLYAYYQARPRPGQPTWVEMLCLMRDGREYIQTAISPLDAAINRRGLERTGDPYTVCSFGDLTLDHFVQTHDGQLNIAITYGFAAQDNRLMVDATGAPTLLSLQQHFSVAAPTDGLYLDFGGIHDTLGQIFSAAGLPEQSHGLETLHAMPGYAIERLATQALNDTGAPIRADHHATQYALYDSAQQCWRFADLDRLRPHGRA